jgi:aminomethyltransferase
MKKTCLYTCHEDLKARLVDFHGWLLPIQYDSMIEEHLAVRTSNGMFDVSHMCPIDIKGLEAKEFIQFLLTTDLAKLINTKDAYPGLYSCLLNSHGGIVDDLIVFQLGQHSFRMVTNAGTREDIHKVLDEHALNYEVEVNFLEDYGMIALQGPEAGLTLSKIYGVNFDDVLKPFHGCFIGDDFISRTGYTGEDGFEVISNEERIVHLWKIFIAHEVRPCGLGSRDSLRIESGLNLYGTDMNQDINPYECGLSWVVDIKKSAFIGQDALLKSLNDSSNITRYGIVLDEPGILRSGYKVVVDEKEGMITSGGYSPYLKKSVGFLRIEKIRSPNGMVRIRDKWLKTSVTNLPFVKRGKEMINLIGENK